MDRDLLKKAVERLDLPDVDKRRPAAMRSRLSRERRASPEVLIRMLLVADVRRVCELKGLATTGRKKELIEALLLSDEPKSQRVARAKRNTASPATKTAVARKASSVAAEARGQHRPKSNDAPCKVAPMTAHLCLDFGTAYCKAATCTPGQPPIPLEIGKAVEQGRGDHHMIRTALFISGSGSLFFGEAAVDRAACDGRIPFDTIKDALTSASDVRKLDDNLPTKYNPATPPISKRQSIALFLAFFTQAALRARHAPEREVTRSIAIPVFAKDKTEWVSRVLAESLAQAHDLAEHFGNELFKSVKLREAIRVLNESERPPTWRGVADPPTVAEPVAAVAAQLLHFTPAGSHAPRLMMVVDVGAGTTDMAMFASGQVDGVVTVHHVEGSKRSIPVAGKAIDQALIAHMVNKADGGDRLTLLLH